MNYWIIMKTVKLPRYFRSDTISRKQNGERKNRKNLWDEKNYLWKSDCDPCCDEFWHENVTNNWMNQMGLTIKVSEVALSSAFLYIVLYFKITSPFSFIFQISFIGPWNKSKKMNRYFYLTGKFPISLGTFYAFYEKKIIQKTV